MEYSTSSVSFGLYLHMGYYYSPRLAAVRVLLEWKSVRYLLNHLFPQFSLTLKIPLMAYMNCSLSQQQAKSIVLWQ
jgi:hypothetical protein